METALSTRRSCHTRETGPFQEPQTGFLRTTAVQAPSSSTVRHAARSDLDDRFKHVYAGILPQSRLDKNLFDRKVGIELYFDEDHRFKTAEVNVYYTFL